jgi:hypothetical protein
MASEYIRSHRDDFMAFITDDDGNPVDDGIIHSLHPIIIIAALSLSSYVRVYVYVYVLSRWFHLIL